MSGLKYVVFAEPNSLVEHFLLFPDFMRHDKVSNAYCAANPGFTPVRAGETSCGIEGFECYGQSDSLGISSDAIKDARLINIAHRGY